jgi:hypothetical protein
MPFYLVYRGYDIVSQWGKRMKERAGRYRAEEQSRETNSYPLRKIVGYAGDKKYPALTYELLECGHKMLPRRDMFGETNAYRRRCRKCAVSEER